MDDQNKNTNTVLSAGAVEQAPDSTRSVQDFSDNSLSYNPTPSPATEGQNPKKKADNLLVRLVKRADIVLGVLLVLGGVGLVLRATLSADQESLNNTAPANRFGITQLPLDEIVTEAGIDFGTQSVTINGPLQLNSGFILSPSTQPTDAVAGQIYYDQTSNVLAYFNGVTFVPLTGVGEISSATIQSAGAGLSINNGQISNTGVLSIQGQTGSIAFSAGNGIAIDGTTISNTGMTNLVSTNPSLIVTDDGNGNYELTLNLEAAGVQSVNGLSGVIDIANASTTGSTITVDDASTTAKGIAQFNGTNFVVGSGVVNTIQNINVGASPTFAGLNTNNITPSSTLTIGSSGQSLILQGSASTQLTATGGGFITSIGFTGIPTGNVTFNFDRATPAGVYTICTTVGNCNGSGGVSTPGGTNNRIAKFTGTQTIGDSSITDDGASVTTSGDLIIQGGDVTVGVINTQTGTISLAHSSSSFLGSLVQGALTANRTYLLPDANGTICLSSGNCSGSGTTNTLQAAYDAGNTITSSDARSIGITLADTATDANFTVNLECDTACGGNGRFAIQDDAVDVFTILPAGGAVNFINTVDSTQAFNIEENGGNNLFTVDTVNSRIGINLGSNNTPTLAGGREGLELRGALRVSGDTPNQFTDLYVTPNGGSGSAKINVVNYDIPQGGQVIALGVTAGSHAESRGVSVYDARTGSHQPSVAVFSVNENDAFGLSWEGSSSDAYLKTFAGDVNIRINTTDAANFTASAVNLLQNTNVSGTLAVTTMGATNTSNYLCLNASNQLSTCATSGTGAAFVQFGNTFGTTAVLGTNDAQALEVETGGVTRMTIAANGSNIALSTNTDFLLQGSTAYISNPQAQTGSESFGLNASVTGTNALAVGNGATSGAEGIALGTGAISGLESIAIGVNATANGPDRIAIGHSAQSTAANQMVIGGSTTVGSYINHLVVGSGITDATPQGFRLQATSGSGTNIAGGNLDIAAGQGTGSASSGSIGFLISQAGAGGTALNGLVTVATIQGGTGAAIFTNAVNSTSAFNIENSSGNNLFTVDTVNSRIGINLGSNNTPTMNGEGLEVNGGVKVSGSSSHSFVTPLGASINADFSVNVQSVTDFTQIFAFGLDASSAASARGIMVADARTVVHQPTIAVLSPDENNIGGFSWDGGNVEFLVKNTNASGVVGLNVGGTTRLQATSTGATVTGTATVTTLGAANSTTYLCHNSLNQIAACSSTATGTSFMQGGNSFGQAATLGTNDGFGLNFEVNTATVMTISTVGAVNLQNQTNSINAFRIQNADASATVFNVDTTNQRVGIGGAASFSKFEVQGGDAAVYNDGANPRIILGDSTAGGQNGFISWDSANDYIRIETTGTNGLKINDNFISIGNLFPDQPLKVGNGSTLLAQIDTTGQATFQNASDSSSAFRVLTSGGLPLFVVDSSNARAYVGNPVADNTGALLVLDSKSTSGDPSGLNGAMYYNVAQNKMRCFEYGFWRDCIQTARTQFLAYSDFMSAGTDSYFIFETSGTTGADNNNNTVGSLATHPGVVRQATGTVSSGRASITSDSKSGILLGNNNEWRYEAVIRIPILSDGTDTYTARAGFIDNNDGESTDGCFFRYTHDTNSGRWQGVCRDNDTETVCDTSITVGADTWYRLNIIVNGAGTAADFQTDGTSRCQVANNIPTGASRGTGYGSLIKKSAGTSDRFLDNDYMEILGLLNASR